MYRRKRFCEDHFNSKASYVIFMLTHAFFSKSTSRYFLFLCHLFYFIVKKSKKLWEFVKLEIKIFLGPVVIFPPRDVLTSISKTEGDIVVNYPYFYFRQCIIWGMCNFQYIKFLIIVFVYFSICSYLSSLTCAVYSLHVLIVCFVVILVLNLTCYFFEVWVGNYQTLPFSTNLKIRPSF